MKRVSIRALRAAAQRAGEAYERAAWGIVSPAIRLSTIRHDPDPRAQIFRDALDDAVSAFLSATAELRDAHEKLESGITADRKRRGAEGSR